MSAKKNAPVKGFDFEASLAQLEKLVARMESGELGLEESLKAFEEGVKLTRQCQETLNAAQQKVQQLMEKNGKPVLQAAGFEEDGDADANDIQGATNIAGGRKPRTSDD